MNNVVLPAELLKQMYVDKELTVKEISESLGVSVGTVFNRLKKYGISRQKYTSRFHSKMSAIKKEWFIYNTSPTLGLKQSDEVKARLSRAKTGRYFRPSKYGGHTKLRKDGYVAIYIPKHPHSTNDGYVMEHILVMEESIGRYLNPDEVVHHKNHIRTDNRIENLQLMTFKEHARFHMNERWELKKGVKTYQ